MTWILKKFVLLPDGYPGLQYLFLCFVNLYHLEASSIEFNFTRLIQANTSKNIPMKSATSVGTTNYNNLSHDRK